MQSKMGKKTPKMCKKKDRGLFGNTLPEVQNFKFTVAK